MIKDILALSLTMEVYFIIHYSLQIIKSDSGKPITHLNQRH